MTSDLRGDEDVNADDVDAEVDEDVNDDGRGVDHSQGKREAEEELEQARVKKTWRRFHEKVFAQIDG
jgi:hypothetical protein